MIIIAQKCKIKGDTFYTFFSNFGPDSFFLYVYQNLLCKLKKEYHSTFNIASS